MAYNRQFYCNAEFSASSAHNTSEGYRVNVDVPIARAGIINYKGFEFGRSGNAANEDVPVYRKVETFTPELLSQFANLPITNNHPEDAVNSGNVMSVIIGTLGDTVYMNGQDLIAGKAIIYEKSAINDIEQGVKQEVSIGFNALYTPEEGEIDGQKYKYIETITGINHLALVSKGKAGSKYRLNEDVSQKIITKNEESEMKNELDKPEDEKSEKDNADMPGETEKESKNSDDMGSIKALLENICSKLDSLTMNRNAEPDEKKDDDVKENSDEDDKDKKDDEDTKGNMKNSMNLANAFGAVDTKKLSDDLANKSVTGKEMKNAHFQEPVRTTLQVLNEVHRKFNQ